VPHVEIPVLPDSLGVTHCLPVDTQVFYSAADIRGIQIRQEKQLIRKRQGSPTQRGSVEGALERVVVEDQGAGEDGAEPSASEAHENPPRIVVCEVDGCCPCDLYKTGRR